MFVLDSLMLRRNDDPAHEFRELRLFKDDRFRRFCIWEVIGFLGDPNPDAERRKEIAMGGSEQPMRALVADR
jgi:hypothetical protein